MSRVELDTFINDRYAAIEDRLQVCSNPLSALAACLQITSEIFSLCTLGLQVVRKRLNRPLTYAVKVTFRPAATNFSDCCHRSKYFNAQNLETVFTRLGRAGASLKRSML